ncbi:serine/arginine-rich splicing factor SR45a-like [Rhodamnia argentea]|uniref:Serine/arginine-rich splicing factor SR45a-like n=1 Tax=Rhodamnia argentea TaxID=178133 RepID=A0A8B8PV08_9MYRT|nr:serine/arginine-rich splicing factor SR45a-like [Rhodamnia argentea]
MPYKRRLKSPSPHDSASPVRGRRSKSRSLSRSRDSASPVRGRRSRSRSVPRSVPRSRRSRSRSQDFEHVSNPGNNLYVTGLSTRVTTSDLEKYFSKEGKVLECQLVTDPRTKDSRGFGFVTMETNKDAERCIKYLNQSVFEGRLITVEKAKRKRGRTPTPGRYLGLKEKQGRGGRRSRSRSPRRRRDDDYYPRDRRGRSRSRSPYGRRERDKGHSDSSRRRRERSLSRDSGGYSR